MVVVTATTYVMSEHDYDGTTHDAMVVLLQLMTAAGKMHTDTSDWFTERLRLMMQILAGGNMLAGDVLVVNAEIVHIWMQPSD